MLRVLHVSSVLIMLKACAATGPNFSQSDFEKLGYEIINQFPTSQTGLYYKTYGGKDELVSQHLIG